MSEIDRLHTEAESLRSEMARTRAEIRKAQEEGYQRHLDTRKMPPMSQMTRLQKRYFLEPWMTALALVFVALSVPPFVLAMFTPLHMEFTMLGFLMLLIGMAFLITKWNLMEWNSRTEPEITRR
jgi:hypothetical protein